MTSRRSFVQAGFALTASAGQAPKRTPAVSSFDPWVEIHAENLRHNVRQIHRLASSRPILAVIKNNGYGMGVVNAARLLEPLPAVHGLAVVKLQEAVSLRDAGIRKPVLLMGPFDERNLEEAIAWDITPMVYTPVGPALDKIAYQRQKPVPVHVCVDTGIGRVGVLHDRAAALIRDLAGRKSVKLQGAMMTFTEDAAFDREQLRRFQSLCSSLEKDRIALGRKHAASSYALFQHPDSFLDMVRPGMAIYGVYPEQDFRGAGAMDLRPALSLKARIIYVKQLRQGDSAGYNRAFRADGDVWIATAPVGHTDGWPRAAVKGARVRINGVLYPVVASVSASHCIIKIGPEPAVQTGDVVTFFNGEEGSRPEDVSVACGVSVYDLLMHLNPLLPRRII